MEPFIVRDLDDYLSGHSRIFDSVRIVDPFLKKVIGIEGSVEMASGSSCYEFWNRNVICENCISINAAREKGTFSKIECNNDGIFLVVATPIIFKGTEYIVEMIKNMFLIDEIYGKNSKELIEITDVISELNKKLMKDELTGVYNRRYINKELPKDIQHAIENEEGLSVIMLDIDCFKDINDVYGHMAGDLVLKDLGNIIKSNIRKNYDWVARFGGDEFFIVLRNSDVKVCNKIIKDIQSLLKENPTIYNGHKIERTISLGGYVLKDKKKKTEEVLYIVDKNLNLAKCNGKNTSVIS